MHSPASRRILVVINKAWEAEAALLPLLSPRGRPALLPDPDPHRLHHPLRPRSEDPGNPPVLPRVVWSLPTAFGRSSADSSADESRVEVEVWCIEDLMSREKGVSSSSTAEKARVLPRAIEAGPAPAFVLAVGTAAHPGETSWNGCVVVGAEMLLFDPYADRPNEMSPWTDPRIGRRLESEGGRILDVIGRELRDQTGVRHQIESRLLPMPLNPARDRLLLASSDALGLSVVNVTDYREYAWTDEAALAMAQRQAPQRRVASLETTHGLIRLQSDAPFLYVSGIADRVGHFAAEVTAREYAQNVAAAHNAGVAVAWLLPAIVRATVGTRPGSASS